MPGILKNFSQSEYTRVLDEAGANAWGQRRCEDFLMDLGATREQAKNGAYNFLHHHDHLIVTKRGAQDAYERILDHFSATTKRPIDCIRHLETLGYSAGQSKSAVYTYRTRRGLIGR